MEKEKESEKRTKDDENERGKLYDSFVLKILCLFVSSLGITSKVNSTHLE